ncbi:MAG: LPS export ABC transporter permease LptG [Pseudomonadota bacterium]
MNISLSTLNIYLAKKYFLNFLAVLFFLLLIIYIFDSIELLRRAADRNDIGLSQALLLSFFKLPEVGQKIFTFSILFSSMITFWQLSKKHELVIMRSAGLSAWQFLIPIIFAAFLIGVFKITVINPVSVMLLKNYDILEARYFDKRDTPITLSDQGLWLKQETDNNSAVVHAKKLNVQDWSIELATVFIFDNQNDFQKRIDSPIGYLRNGVWEFRDVIENSPGFLSERSQVFILETPITREQLEENFSSPETVSFWDFPQVIEQLDATGFRSSSLKIYYQVLLSQPLLFISMVLLAACVSIKPARMQNSFLLVIIGIGMGFAVFFSSNFLQALGASEQIPLFIAAWFPAIISFLLGIGFLMNYEDG